ncbi:reverse transcriptase domain-containing protein [Tanacetum coccineum]
MHTRSQSRNLHHQQHQAPPPVVEPFNLEEPIENPDPLAPMDDTRTMAQLLEAPTAGYEDAIVVPEITADNFELKHDHFYDEVPERPEYVGKAYAFPIFPRGAARIWLEKEPPRSIQTWDDLVSKFINKFFPPSKTTNLRNEITRFQQRFDETFYEAWDRFNDLLRACPHHGFSELHQLDTFYNALNSNDQDSLNSAAGGNFLDKMPRDCLRIIESKSKVRNSRNKPVVAKVSSTSAPGISIRWLLSIKNVKALLLYKKINLPPHLPTPPQLTTTKETPVIEPRFQIKFDLPVFLPFKTIIMCKIKETIRIVTTKTGGISIKLQLTNPRFSKVKSIDLMFCFKLLRYQAPAYQAPAPQIQGVSKEDFQAYVKANDAVMRNMQTQGQNMQNQLTNLTDMLSKFVTSNTASTSGTLPSNTVTNPKEDLKGITTRSGVAYKGPTIPITSSPKVVEREPEVTKDTMLPTNNGSTEDVQPPVVPVSYDRSISEPIGIAEDVYVTVGKFQFPADFVVVDFEPDPRVPLILGRSFLKTSHALIDVYEGEITLRVGREAITFNLDQTSRYTANYNHMTANRIDVIDMACEEYSQEFLVLNVISSGNPTPYYDPIVSTASPTLTPFGDSDFLLFEEADSFLAIEDDPTSPEVDPTYYDPDGDILLLEAILNSDPSPPPPNQGNYFPETRKDLKICEANNEKSSINEPPEVELKDLPPHLEYAFLEGNDKLPVIIAKDLKNEEKAALIEVLKSHKRAIAWKLSDIKGIDPEFCTHKILMEEDYEPTVQHQRRVNPKIHDVIKKEVEKLLDAGLIYPISDSPWTRRTKKKTTLYLPITERFAFAACTFGDAIAPGTCNEVRWQSPHDMIEKAKAVFRITSQSWDSFSTCLSHLDKMLKRCEDANLVLNWEKSHFMVKEGIILGHKISKSGIEVDRAKVDVIAKLPHPTTVKVLGQRQNKHFQPIHYANKTMTDAQAHYTTTKKELLAVVYAFEKFRSYLVLSKSIMYTDHSTIKYLFAKKDAKPRLMRWIILLKEFDVIIRDKKGAENLAADHLSKIENPHQDKLDNKEITETFPLETLGSVALRVDSTSWFADFANYHVGNFIIKGMSSHLYGSSDPAMCARQRSSRHSRSLP